MNKFDQFHTAQKQFYKTKATKDIAFRKNQLIKLFDLIRANESEILSALYNDFRKSDFETYGTEVGLVLSEIRFQISNLKKHTSPKPVSANILDFLSFSRIYPEPLGQVLIIAPWNYPFQLIISPLAGAIAAGNTVFLKPSELSPHTSKLITRLISENFPPEFICCIEGDKHVSEELLKLKFDLIFFTGSSKTGQIVMEAAAKSLSRICLELGGKNPCIIDKTADLELSCKRIVWGKFLNAGQTCVAPDYILVNRSISQTVKEKLKKYITVFYGDDIKGNKDFPRIINNHHFQRIKRLIDSEKVFFGGETEAETLFISPTILHNVVFSDPVMQEEVFGPVLPLVEYEDIEEIIEQINNGPTPLSFYLFARNKKLTRKLVSEIEAGNVNINDTVMQFSNKSIPFGGKRESGMGSHHGKYSFECFSHRKAVNYKSLLIDPSFRYPPYNKLKYNVIKMFLK
jgi:aldehyde dehydrogenase (NAD+)